MEILIPAYVLAFMVFALWLLHKVDEDTSFGNPPRYPESYPIDHDTAF